MVRAAMMSNPSVGSSKIITGGSCTSVRAIEVFCFMPVDSLSHRRSRKESMSSRAKISSMRRFSVASSRPFRRPKYSTISWAVSRGYNAVAVDRNPTLARTRSGCSTTSWPNTRAVPSVGSRIVASMRSVVVFPAPLAPSKPYMLPGWQVKLTFSTATIRPRFLS